MSGCETQPNSLQTARAIPRHASDAGANAGLDFLKNRRIGGGFIAYAAV